MLDGGTGEEVCVHDPAAVSALDSSGERPIAAQCCTGASGSDGCRRYSGESCCCAFVTCE